MNIGSYINYPLIINKINCNGCTLQVTRVFIISLNFDLICCNPYYVEKKDGYLKSESYFKTFMKKKN